VADGDAIETVDYESLFKLRISSLLTGLFSSHPDLPTRVVLVPSLQDVAHDFVFPQVGSSSSSSGGSR